MAGTVLIYAFISLVLSRLIGQTTCEWSGIYGSAEGMRSQAAGSSRMARLPTARSVIDRGSTQNMWYSWPVGHFHSLLVRQLLLVCLPAQEKGKVTKSWNVCAFHALFLSFSVCFVCLQFLVNAAVALFPLPAHLSTNQDLADPTPTDSGDFGELHRSASVVSENPSQFKRKCVRRLTQFQDRNYT